MMSFTPPLIVAHRGSSALYPENTLYGVTNTFTLGVDAIEIDVHLTKDQHVIVHHDSMLSIETTRHADGKWIDQPISIKELSLKELQSYDVGTKLLGSSRALKYPTSVNIDRESPPSLATLLQNLKHRPEQLWIELKTSYICPNNALGQDLADAVMRCIYTHGTFSRIRLISFDWQTLDYITKTYPHMAIGYVSADPLEPILTQGLLKPGSFWNVCFENLTQTIVQGAQAQGLRLGAWTLNTTQEFQTALPMSLWAITTDAPHLLKDFLCNQRLSL